MLAICKADTPVAFKAPRTSSHTKKKDSQGKKPGAKSGHKKQSSLKHPSVSSIEATKGVTSEDGANPQLSSGMSAFTHIKAIFLAFFIIHFESALGYDASADSTAKTDLGKSAPNDYLPPQQSMNEGTKNYSLDHTFTGTDPNVLADKTHFVSEGLETVLTRTNTWKGTSTIARQFEEDEA
ncbi:hypothetical protein Tco_1283468 [Tanacetum coccineum]